VLLAPPLAATNLFGNERHTPSDTGRHLVDGGCVILGRVTSGGASVLRSVVDHAAHTPYSDPGRYAGLLAAVPPDPPALSAIARNVIVHYRASGHDLPPETRHEINARWLEDIVAADQRRHPRPLAEPRAVVDRVQGCCRDHSLFCVGALRSHGIAARTRVGFAGYFVDGWHHDHVVVEAWLDGRWVRFDSELDGPRPALPTPMDIGPCSTEGTGFITAAEAWLGYRRGQIDADTFGVGPEILGFRGPSFLFNEVIFEVAHRFGDDLLLWDGWGRIGEPDRTVTEQDAAWLDPVAELLTAADHGDLDAERSLLERYRSDEGLHPGPVVQQASPNGEEPVEVRLRQS
jgi:hypothetical protein